MNGRFVQLAYQAKLFNGMPAPFDEVKKFAELIVKECMEQVWYTREDMVNDNISEVIKLRIKEHFGVEE
jgi:hypothetical protein